MGQLSTGFFGASAAALYNLKGPSETSASNYLLQAVLPQCLWALYASMLISNMYVVHEKCVDTHVSSDSVAEEILSVLAELLKI